MSDEHQNGNDAIPVLSDVVQPGTIPAPPSPEAATGNEAAQLLAERLNFQASLLLADMATRVARMVEDELARAHSAALETASLALQKRLRMELEGRMAKLVEDLLNHNM